MNEMYQYSVPVYIKMLGSLRHLVEKAEAFAKEKGMEESALLASALAPDMFPFVRQIQVSCDQAKNATARLAGVEAPVHEDTEKTFEELKARIDKTVEYLKTISQSAFEAAATRKIEMKYFPGKYLEGRDYLREYAMPNFLFHITTTYDILRHLGAELHKADYLPGLSLKDL